MKKGRREAEGTAILILMIEREKHPFKSQPAPKTPLITPSIAVAEGLGP